MDEDPIHALYCYNVIQFPARKGKDDATHAGRLIVWTPGSALRATQSIMISSEFSQFLPAGKNLVTELTGVKIIFALPEGRTFAKPNWQDEHAKAWFIHDAAQGKADR